MASGNDLVEKIGSLLIERQVAKLVHDERRGLGIGFELADQRVIYLRSEQMIQHVHGGGEQDALVGLADAPADDFGKEGLAHPRIPNEHKIGTLCRNSRSSRRRMRFLFCDRVL